MKANIEFSRIVSKFLIDKDRAGSLRVNSQMYMNLTLHLLKFLSDRCVYNPHTLIHTNTNAWFHSRRFVDIVDVNTVIPKESTTYYEVGKLGFNLLPILLPRIRALGGFKAREVIAFLRSQPRSPFPLIKDDPLESQKVKAAQAIKDFLKVWFSLTLLVFSGADNSQSDSDEAVYSGLFQIYPLAGLVATINDVINYFWRPWVLRPNSELLGTNSEK